MQELAVQASSDNGGHAIHLGQDRDGDASIQIDNPNTGTANTSRFAATSYGNHLVMQSYGDNHATYPSLNRLWTNAGSPSDISIDTGTPGTKGVFIKNDGKVGIGTAIPDSNLHISGAGSAIVRIEGETASRLMFETN